VEIEEVGSEAISPPLRAGSVALARAMTKALRAMEEAPAEVAGAVNEHVAAARLGVSLDVIRRDRRTGQLGIPYIKLGPGKRGLVRYDLDDLDRWVASKKQVGKRSVVEAQVPVAPVEQVEEPVERIDLPMPVRRPPPRTPWEALAERYAEEPEDDPFAQAGRTPQRRGPAGYFL
jgi:hypothetical protein